MEKQSHEKEEVKVTVAAKKIAAKKKAKSVKERIVAISGSLSGATSFLGSYQVCHNLCMSLIALLSLVGVTIAFMPLLFLTKVAVPFWAAAVALLLLTLWLYFKKRCVSEKLIIFNSGLIVAGVPFQSLQRFSLVFWSVGGVLVALSLILLIKDKVARKTKARSAKTGHG